MAHPSLHTISMVRRALNSLQANPHNITNTISSALRRPPPRRPILMALGQPTFLIAIRTDRLDPIIPFANLQPTLVDFSRIPVSPSSTKCSIDIYPLYSLSSIPFHLSRSLLFLHNQSLYIKKRALRSHPLSLPNQYNPNCTLALNSSCEVRCPS